jgi:uncharacterized damage-inducible protein DinB
MRLRDQAVALAAYNRWMNEKVYAAASQLSDDERKRDLGAFFRSVHGTLNHILLADRSWLQRFRGEQVTMTSPHDELYPLFDRLRSARRVTDLEIEQFAGGLDEDDSFADAPFRFWSVTYGKERVVPGWAAVLHMFNHQTHHRGQVTTLLKQLGQDPGVTDLPWMPHFD